MSLAQNPIPTERLLSIAAVVCSTKMLFGKTSQQQLFSAGLSSMLKPPTKAERLS
jgi:hypothetical protein